MRGLFSFRISSRALLAPACSICLMALAASSARADAGAAGLAFLKLGTAGRGVAMGDAMTATVGGAAATHYNPAGLAAPLEGGTTFEFLFMHKEWIQDSRTEFLGARIGLTDHDAIGVSVLTTTVSDIEVRTRPGEPEGTFSSRDLAVGISYSHAVDERLRLGLTGRFLYEQILIDDVQGVGIDVGMQYDGLVDGLAIGAALANVGSMSKFRNESLALPTLARFGAAYTMNLAGMESKVVLAADLEDLLKESVLLTKCGAEWAFRNNFFVRAGYQFGSEGRGLSVGGGLQYGALGADYALSRLSNDLGNGHTVTLRVKF